MITKFEKYNESLRDLMVGPTKEEVWYDLMNGKLKGFLKSIPESAEDFFNQMKDGCEEMGEDINGIYFGKNNIKLFQQNIKEIYLYINYKYIWSIFEKIYGLNYSGVQSIIRSLLINDTKLNGYNPSPRDNDLMNKNKKI